MIRFWNVKNRIATSTVISKDAASFSGYCDPRLSWPEDNAATPLVRVVNCGSWVETMKWASSFQEPWKAMIEIVTTAGVATGRTIDQNVRNVPAPSIQACSSTDAGIDSKKFFMMKIPAASTRSGSVIATQVS